MQAIIGHELLILKWMAMPLHFISSMTRMKSQLSGQALYALSEMVSLGQIDIEPEGCGS